MTQPSVPVYAVHLNCDRPPLGLGMIVATIKADAAVAQHLDFSPGYFIDEDALQRAIAARGPGLFLFSSFIWNARAHLRVSERIRRELPGSFIVHGGPYLPRTPESAEEFLAFHPFLDVLCHGEGEEAIGTLLSRHLRGGPVAGVPGTTAFAAAPAPELAATAPPRCPLTAAPGPVAELATLPSAYLSGEFARYMREHAVPVASLETSRGCPYSCAFCDWGQATHQKVRQFSLERIEQELDWIGASHIPIVELTDANFGIFERDVLVAEALCRTKQKYGYPKELCANFSKNVYKHVIEIIRMTKAAGLVSQAILSIQTLNPPTLAVIGRKNLNQAVYEGALRQFRALDLPVTAEFMLGLPNSTLDSFQYDLQWACQQNMGVYVHSTILIPNTEIASAAFRGRFALKTVAETRFNEDSRVKQIGITGLRDDQVVSGSSMTPDDFLKMLKLTSIYHIFYGESTLKYVLFHLRRAHGIREIDVMTALQYADLTPYPVLLRFRDMGDAPASTITFAGEEDVIWDFVRHNKWRDLYDDFRRYLHDTHGLHGDPELELAFEVQQFVMAYHGRPIPDRRHFPHDFAAYYNDALGAADVGAPRALRDYPPAVLEASDPLRMCSKEERPEYYEPHHGHTELATQLNAVRFGHDLREELQREHTGVAAGGSSPGVHTIAAEACRS